ncbi:uncharacterized protein LOC114448865 [Parambassis ranga]|uniref:Uncharacterized protein LOC114448254 n=1 Tax=Parambassis ranga TaxID=210632 RepID=A0A6P7JVF8_9TELE|nr:uncharacterized protein LOC114448254 [Parambassis ranga]XP_028280900.1 uncharacterized protein LOC114448254 [Parambassis ranga]XP_028281880.1 uncharacterized protein LOC114448865 [Parambassis ranga]XP_028281881.1 uncharacterized protein LOC114448865 [Parambassis ranga]
MLGLQRRLTPAERTRTLVLCFMVSGCLCEVTVEQPPLVSAALGHDVIMPCVLQVTAEDTMVTPPILYWSQMMENVTTAKLWTPSPPYKGRVDLLDTNRSSNNKSILLRNVQWTDSGKYECKMSITTKKSSFRKKGRKTALVVHDTMLFNVTVHNGSLLRCEVNVTRDPGLSLVIVHNNSCRLQTEDSAAGGAVHTALSASAPLRGGGRYECRLSLEGLLITQSFFYSHLPVSGEAGQTDTGATAHPPVVYPEPWFLYVTLLLVHVIVLLVILAAMLRYKVSARGGATNT